MVWWGERAGVRMKTSWGVCWLEGNEKKKRSHPGYAFIMKIRIAALAMYTTSSIQLAWHLSSLFSQVEFHSYFPFAQLFSLCSARYLHSPTVTFSLLFLMSCSLTEGWLPYSRIGDQWEGENKKEGCTSLGLSQTTKICASLHLPRISPVVLSMVDAPFASVPNTTVRVVASSPSVILLATCSKHLFAIGHSTCSLLKKRIHFLRLERSTRPNNAKERTQVQKPKCMN